MAIRLTKCGSREGFFYRGFNIELALLISAVFMGSMLALATSAIAFWLDFHLSLRAETGGVGGHPMQTALSSVTEPYLRAKRLALATRNEYF